MGPKPTASWLPSPKGRRSDVPPHMWRPSSEMSQMPSGSSGPPGVPRYTTLQRRLLTLSAGVGVAVLAGVLFVLSYDDLRALALAGRAARRFASAYPVMYDALVVVTILSLVVARHARWWSRWSRWLLLLVLAGGAAAASVQRAMNGYDTLPDQTLVAGVAAAPHAMLVIAVMLWITMFRQARASLVRRTGGRRSAASAPKAEEEAEGEAGTGTWPATEAGAGVDAASEAASELAPLRHTVQPVTDQAIAYGGRASGDLVPGMREPHPAMTPTIPPTPTPTPTTPTTPTPTAKEPEQAEKRSEPQRRDHGAEPWLDADDPDQVHAEPVHAESVHAESVHAGPETIQAGPVHAEPVHAERAIDVSSEPSESLAPSEHLKPPEPSERSDSEHVEHVEPSEPSEPADADFDIEPDETEPHVGVVHEEEPPRPAPASAPASLPTDVKLVSRTSPGASATTWPDIVIADPPDPAEDDVDASCVDRAEDPDAGEDELMSPGWLDREDADAAEHAAGDTVDDADRWSAAGVEDVQRWTSESADAHARRYREPSSEAARNVEWPPSSKFRSSPTPPTD
jgi:hypothetical protein